MATNSSLLHRWLKPLALHSVLDRIRSAISCRARLKTHQQPSPLPSSKPHRQPDASGPPFCSLTERLATVKRSLTNATATSSNRLRFSPFKVSELHFARKRRRNMQRWKIKDFSWEK